MAAELYLADVIKRALNERHGTNFTLLQYGTYAARRRAEMANPQVDPREYLGMPVRGGLIEARASMILARYEKHLAEMESGTATTTATATGMATEMARSVVGKMTAVQRAEAMTVGGFIEGLLRWLFWPVTFVLSLLWNIVTTILSWTFWILLLISIPLVLYFLFQGLVFLPAFETVQRRVWYEDLGEPYRLGNPISAAFKAVLKAVGWAIAAPFRFVWRECGLVRESEGCRVLCDFWRRGRRAIRRETERAWNDLLYNAGMDWGRLQYWRFTTWLRRNALRILIAGVVIWVGWRCLAQDGEGEEIVHFNNMQEMAAYFGVPHDPFVPKKEFGSNSHYRAETREPVQLGHDLVGFGDDTRIEDSIPIARAEVSLDEGIEALLEMAAGNSETLQSEPVVEDSSSQDPEEPVVVRKRPLGEGQVAYCRKCRQRHCCEAVNAEPAPTTLSLEL